MILPVALGPGTHITGRWKRIDRPHRALGTARPRLDAVDKTGVLHGQNYTDILARGPVTARHQKAARGGEAEVHGGQVSRRALKAGRHNLAGQQRPRPDQVKADGIIDIADHGDLGIGFVARNRARRIYLGFYCERPKNQIRLGIADRELVLEQTGIDSQVHGAEHGRALAVVVSVWETRLNAEQGRRAAEAEQAQGRAGHHMGKFLHQTYTPIKIHIKFLRKTVQYYVQYTPNACALTLFCYSLN